MTDRIRQIAREGLVRTKPFVLSERADAQDPGDGLTLQGHAAAFNSPTVIDSWEGRFTEEIAPGAFKKTFRETTPVLQFDHGHHPLVGSIPIGKIRKAEEDDIGAFVDARLSDNWLVQPVRDAIQEGSISGMSFRFSVVKEEWRDEEGKLVRDDESLLRLLWSDSDFPTRTLREVKVPELGPVVFPAYASTDVGVRSAGRKIIDLGELATNREARKSLARALFAAEAANVRSSTDEDEPLPVGQEHSTDEGDEPLADEQQHSGQQDQDPTPSSESARSNVAQFAAEMRARLNSVNRS